jgi:hypothetical protein
MLGPGLITGSSDDDPSGIATYSQVGAQFGYGMLWTMVFSYPLMTAIKEISARVGRVTVRHLRQSSAMLSALCTSLRNNFGSGSERLQLRGRHRRDRRGSPVVTAD